MTLNISFFLSKKIGQQYLFLFPNIPYWFIIDSEKEKNTLIEFFSNIHKYKTLNEALKKLGSKLDLRELKDLLLKLEKVGVIGPQVQKRKGDYTPAPNLPRIAQISLEVTRACNLSCVHCSVTAGTSRTDELTLEEIERILKETVQLMKGRKEAVITGGEPFLRSDIFNILEICYNLKFKRILLLTNGTLINREIGKRLEELNNRIEKQNTPEKLIQRLHIQVSIDGNKSTHDHIRGPNAFNQTVNGIKILKRNNISTTLGMVVNNLNIDDVASVIELGAELNCGVGFSSMIKTGRAKDAAVKPVSAARVIPVIMEYLERDPAYIKYLANFPCSPYIIAYRNLIKFRYCGTGWATAYVDSAGDVYPCQIGATVPEFKAGNIRETSFKEIWQNAPILKEMRKLHVDNLNEECSTCEIRYFCGGGCRTQAYLDTGNLCGMDPKCTLGENKGTAWGAFRMVAEYPEILEEVSELGIVKLMEGLFQEMST